MDQRRTTGRMSDADAETWQPIESAPKDQEILVYTRPWGPIIATLSEEFGEWLSRMQVPVSIKEENELPTHWRPLPEPPESVPDRADKETAPGRAERRDDEQRPDAARTA